MTSTRKKILFFANGIPPQEGLINLGPDQRAEQIIEGLEHLGHEVITSLNLGLVSPENCKYIPENLRRFPYNDRSMESIFNEVKPDIVYFAPFTSHAELWTPPVPTIVELGGPMLLESAFTETDSTRLLDRFQGEINAIHKDDLLVAYGERQKRYYFIEMIFAGFNLDKPPQITFWHNGFNPRHLDTLPAREPNSEPRFVYVGGIYKWMNPIPMLTETARMIAHKGKGKLEIITPPPLGDVSSERYNAIATLANEMPWAIRIQPPMPFNSLVKHLMNFDVALEFFEENYERSLAVPFRTAQMLGCGLPIITSSNMELSDLIKNKDAGWVGKAGDQKWLSETLDNIFLNHDLVVEKSQNAKQLALNELSIYHNLEPISDFIENAKSKETNKPHVFANGTFWLSPPEKKLIKFLRKSPFTKMRKIASKLLS